LVNMTWVPERVLSSGVSETRDEQRTEVLKRPRRNFELPAVNDLDLSRSSPIK
jgi:hypothetical protein